MNELIEAFILGIVQGLTEFLPVSSSGHLELMKFLLNDDSIAEQSMLTTVFLHFATALATIFVFKNDLISLFKGLFSNTDSTSSNYVINVLVSMIPAVFVGLMFEDLIESFFHRKIILVSSMLIVTGLLLLLSEKVKSGLKPMSKGTAFLVGIAQAFAITPGISRSGATIASSLMLGIERSEAARFSFLMVIPLIFGKIAKDLLSGDLVHNMPSIAYLIVGFIAAFVTGVIACKLMLKLVKKAKLEWFAVYCFIIGASFILYSI